VLLSTSPLYTSEILGLSLSYPITVLDSSAVSSLARLLLNSFTYHKGANIYVILVSHIRTEFFGSFS
jgi:hypothetical protein